MKKTRKMKTRNKGKVWNEKMRRKKPQEEKRTNSAKSQQMVVGRHGCETGRNLVLGTKWWTTASLHCLPTRLNSGLNAEVVWPCIRHIKRGCPKSCCPEKAGVPCACPCRHNVPALQDYTASCLEHASITFKWSWLGFPHNSLMRPEPVRYIWRNVFLKYFVWDWWAGNKKLCKHSLGYLFCHRQPQDRGTPTVRC